MKHSVIELNEFLNIDGPDYVILEDDPEGVDSYRSFSGWNHTEETLEILREKNLGENNARYGVVLTAEERSRCAPKKGNKGVNNPMCKTFILTDPSGKEHSVTGRLRSFCKEHNISFSTMHTATLHNRKGPRSNGWEIRKGEEG